MRKRSSVESRFWTKVDKNGPVPAHRPELGPCWVWTGCKTIYGRLMIGSRTDGSRRPERASRVSLEISLGRPIREGMFALHACDNPTCVNPLHLFEGTNRDNMVDMVSKGRHRGIGAHRGEKHHLAKLTDRESEMIRIEYAGGLISQIELGKKFGIKQAQVSRIINRKRRAKGIA